MGYIGGECAVNAELLLMHYLFEDIFQEISICANLLAFCASSDPVVKKNLLSKQEMQV